MSKISLFANESIARLSINRLFLFICMIGSGASVLLIFSLISVITIKAYDGLIWNYLKINYKYPYTSSSDIIEEFFQEKNLLQLKSYFTDNKKILLKHVVKNSKNEIIIKLPGELHEIIATNNYNDQFSLELKILKQQNFIFAKLNKEFFTNNDSQSSALAGVRSSLRGLILVIFYSLLISISLALFSAIYLSEFKNNYFTRFFESSLVNFNSIPPLLYGLISLLIFINYFNLPRSSVLIGSLTLSSIILPNLIINFTDSFRSVPLIIRQSALSLGLNKFQLIIDHILPMAFPSIITSVILNICRIIGETAPLLLIGMIAFITTSSTSISPLAPNTTLTAQIYLWSYQTEVGFNYLCYLAILFLILIILFINNFAIWIRKQNKS